MPAAGATVSPLGGQASFRTLGRRPITRRANASSALLVGVGVSRPRAPASAEPADARERAFRAAAREHRVRITSEQADIWPSDSSAKPGEKQWPGAFFLSLSLSLSRSLSFFPYPLVLFIIHSVPRSLTNSIVGALEKSLTLKYLTARTWSGRSSRSIGAASGRARADRTLGAPMTF